MSTKNILTFLLFSFTQLSFSQASNWGVRPITDLASQADLVVLAELQNASRNSSTETVQLRIGQTLKGKSTDLVAFAEFDAPTARMTFMNGALHSTTATAPLLGESIGKSGIWFLQFENGKFRVLPLNTSKLGEFEPYLPVVKPYTDEPAQPVNVQLLGYLAAWYISEPDPGRAWLDQFLSSSLRRADPHDAAPIAASLVASPDRSIHIMGLAASIMLSNDQSVSAAANELSFLGSDRRFHLVKEALMFDYQVRTPTAVLLMQQILQRHDQMPNLDDAIAAVLQRIGGKEVVPAFAETLDSKNDEARLRAVSFLSKVARFADKSGNLQPYTGPLDSPRNHQNEPRSGSPLTTDQYASYWKIWWAENKGKLGFAQ